MSHLMQEQRYTIEVFNKENYSQTAIAERISKHKSIVCMELRLNCDKRNKSYRASLIHRKCEKKYIPIKTKNNFYKSDKRLCSTC